MIVRVSALALSCALASASALSHAGVIDNAQKAEAAKQQTWSAWGGDIGFRWNRGLLGNIGMHLEAAPSAQTSKDLRGHEWFAVRESGGLVFTVKNGSMEQFTGGALQMRGGYTLRLPDASAIDLRDLSLRVRNGDPKILDAVSGDGKAWFYTDRVMFELADEKHTLAIRAADLRIAPALANRIGRPESANWEIADLILDTQINIEGTDVVEGGSCAPYPWPGAAVSGVPGESYKADLFMEAITFDPVGCELCDGPGGANDGTVSWAPSSTLRNNVNDGTAQATVSGDPLGTSTALYAGYIAWWTKFTGSAPSYNPPYKNDQHPFLIWDLYRFNADGSFEQIGRSGVKHAFVSVNVGCLDSCDHMGGHALGRGCGDTYGTGNNDSPWDMAPRSEIVPAKGLWGRCGSIFDPDCTGEYAIKDGGNDEWTQRLKTHESQVDPAANAGATYMLDSWYIARQDINIYNSMATVTGTPHYAGSLWSFNGQSNYRLGAAIDRWVDPANPQPNSMNTELAVDEGHVKVAVKVTDLGDGTWRYDYAVMNFDFARAITQGAGPDGGPDPRVLSNKGFDSFEVPAGGTIGATKFSNGTVDGSGAWTMSNAGGAVVWTAPDGGSLDWGTMYSYSVTSTAAPVEGVATLHIAESGDPASYDVATLVPTPGGDPNDPVFANGFDTAP
jgi:hypothetical protein